MQVLKVLVVTMLLSPNLLSAEKDLLDAYSSDARISQSVGDYYRSYKIYTYLYANHNDYFKKHNVETYLQVSAKIASLGRFNKLCKILAKDQSIKNRVLYQCAKILYEKGENVKASKAVAQINTKRSNLKARLKLLKASIDIVNERYKGCIKTLNKDQVKLFQSENLDDIFHLSRARCYNSSGDYKEAVVEYQSINSNSRYYFDSLLELSWTLFKLRDVERVKNTAKTILTTYNPKIEKLQKDSANANHYFEVNYILAYLDLVVFNGKNTSKFEDIILELKRYRKENFLKKKELKSFYQSVLEADSLSELRLKNKKYERVIYQIGQWLPYQEVQGLESHVAQYIAAKKEFLRTKNFNSAYKKYNKTILSLTNYHKDQLKKKLSVVYDNSNKAIEGLILKNKIGSLDLQNLNKTKGLRSLEQATANYKEKESNLRDKFGVIE